MKSHSSHLNTLQQHNMAYIHHLGIIAFVAMFMLFISVARPADIYHEWNVSFSTDILPYYEAGPAITINGMLPGPLINATVDDYIHVNIFNNLDEPFLMTWNGLQQRRNSWQDGVSGTNCPIQPGKNWTYVFQTKDQIGSFFYFPSINYHKAAGGYGPIRINNRKGVQDPFPKPEAEFDLLIGDWPTYNYTEIKWFLDNGVGFDTSFGDLLVDGKGIQDDYTSFNVTKGKTYKFRISNVGSGLSFNFQIQNHTMVLVETEGTYTNLITLDSLDVHVGQSYSVLVTMNQFDMDYYMMATSVLGKANNYVQGLGLLHYADSTIPAVEPDPFPSGHDGKPPDFSVNQARSIRSNMTTAATRPNPEGRFNITNITLSQTFILHAFMADINGRHRSTVNNVAYLTPNTPLKLADHLFNGTGVFNLDAFPVNSINGVAVTMTSVVSGVYKGWLEIVFKNEHDVMDSWHLDGFNFYVVGFGDGDWSQNSRSSYNLIDPIVRSTVQVYPGGWSAVYVYLDNPGMWNLRSQILQNWYLGEELYIRVHDLDGNATKELPPPHNELSCGATHAIINAPPSPSPQMSWSPTNRPSSYFLASLLVSIISWMI